MKAAPYPPRLYSEWVASNRLGLSSHLSGRFWRKAAGHVESVPCPCRTCRAKLTMSVYRSNLPSRWFALADLSRHFRRLDLPVLAFALKGTPRLEMHLTLYPSAQVIEITTNGTALRAHHLTNWQLILQGFLPQMFPPSNG